MRILIAGAGRVGGDLAFSFADAGHDVSVIDLSEKALESLGSTFNGSTHVGLAYDVDVLKGAGIRDADVFIAVTDSDNANLMAVQVAKKVFSVPRTVARLDDPAREQVYRTLGVEYVAGARLVSKVIFEDIIEQEFLYHTTFAGGDVDIVDMVLGPAAGGVRVGDFEVIGKLRVAAIERKGEVAVPDEFYILQPGDRVVAAAKAGVRSKVARYLAGKGF